MIDIRAATPDDAAAIAAIYAPYVVTNAVSFESETPGTRGMPMASPSVLVRLIASSLKLRSIRRANLKAKGLSARCSTA
jgi:L-amino acid N-acyltransferase YncA